MRYCAAVARTVDAVASVPTANRVAVAMSGGVDSAVALLKVVEAGLEPVGVTLRLWIDPAAPDSERACCSPQSVRAARAACHALGVAHVGLDLRQEFRQVVVDEFVSEYGAGRTPNPCVRCNGSFRFDALASFADRIGAGRIATGHYARAVTRGGRSAGSEGGRHTQGPVLHARPSGARDPGAHVVPAGRTDQAGDARAGARRRLGGGRASREPGGVLRRRRRSPGVPGALWRRRGRPGMWSTCRAE